MRFKYPFSINFDFSWPRFFYKVFCQVAINGLIFHFHFYKKLVLPWYYQSELLLTCLSLSNQLFNEILARYNFARNLFFFLLKPRQLILTNILRLSLETTTKWKLWRLHIWIKVILLNCTPLTIYGTHFHSHHELRSKG